VQGVEGAAAVGVGSGVQGGEAGGGAERGGGV